MICKIFFVIVYLRVKSIRRQYGLIHHHFVRVVHLVSLAQLGSGCKCLEGINTECSRRGFVG